MNGGAGIQSLLLEAEHCSWYRPEEGLPSSVLIGGRRILARSFMTAQSAGFIPARNIIRRMPILPAGISLRPASAADEPAIRAIVRKEGLNPLSLHWRNFLLAMNAEERIVGIGAVKQHGDGSRELASIAVVPEWRGRGVAGVVIDTLLSRESGPLYLTCRDKMAPFYERFGFRRIGEEEMTPYFRRLSRIVGVVIHLVRAGNGPVVMKKDNR